MVLFNMSDNPPFEVVLSHYNSLKGISIIIKEVSSSLFPYAARPLINSIFRKAHKRKYAIYLLRNPLLANKELQFINLPYQAQIGILGHEIAHIYRYNKSSGMQIIRDGIYYFWPSFRKKYEKNTDRICIRHGLGMELLLIQNMYISIFQLPENTSG